MGSKNYFPNTNCIRTIIWPFTFMNISCCLGQSILGGLFLLNGWSGHSSACRITISLVGHLLSHWNRANIALKENWKKQLLVHIHDQQISVLYYWKLGVLMPYSTASLSFASLSTPSCVIVSRQIFKFSQHLLRTRMKFNRWQKLSRCMHSQESYVLPFSTPGTTQHPLVISSPISPSMGSRSQHSLNTVAMLVFW